MQKKLVVVAKPFNIAINYFDAKEPAPDSLLIFLNKLIASGTQCLLPPATECGKEMFLVVSVCPSVHGEGTYDHTQTCSNLFSCAPRPRTHMETPDPAPIPVQTCPLGIPSPDPYPHPLGDDPGLPPTQTCSNLITWDPPPILVLLPRPVRTCSLCNLCIYQQVGG